MKTKKVRDFAAKKARVGKEQFRKHDSKDAKLLANIGQLKKTVKVATQSIAVNKDRLNVTSRRLTLAELIGKTRHTSDAVRHHALLGILEFTRRFEEDARLNLYAIVQVAAASLTSGAASVRRQGRTLLLAALTDHLVPTCDEAHIAASKSAECVLLHVIQGALSSDAEIRQDVYHTIVTMMDKAPSIIAESVDNLIATLLKRRPESLVPRHVDCLYALFKHRKEGGGDPPPLGPELVDYAYGVLDHALSAAEAAASELDCLTASSMITKCLKLLLFNIRSVAANDARLIKALLFSELFEFDGMTERGKMTFEALYADVVLTKAEIGIRCIAAFSRYHLALLAPMVQLHSLRKSLGQSHAQQVAGIVLTAMATSPSAVKSHSLKLMRQEWRRGVLEMLPPAGEDPLLEPLRRALQADVSALKVEENVFQPADKQPERDESPRGSIRLDRLFVGLCRGLVDCLAQRPEILPIIAIAQNVAPQVCAELFLEARGDGGGAQTKGFDFVSRIPDDFETRLRLNMDVAGMLGHFIANGTDKPLSIMLLRTLLHVSRQKGSFDELQFVRHYLAQRRVRELDEEELCLVARILLNCTNSSELVEPLIGLFKARVADKSLCSLSAAAELMGAMAHHLFASSAEQRTAQSAGIDEHLAVLNRVATCVGEVAKAIETKLDEDSLDLLELVLGQSVSGTLDSLLRSHSNNVWSVAAGRVIIFTRCLLPICERLAKEGLRNMAVCVMKEGALPQLAALGKDFTGSYVERCSGEASKVGGNNAIKEAGRPAWMCKLLEPAQMKRYSPALINRLPAADGTEEAVTRLCDTVLSIIE